MNRTTSTVYDEDHKKDLRTGPLVRYVYIRTGLLLEYVRTGTQVEYVRTG